MSFRALIFGAEGMLGTDLIDTAPRPIDATSAVDPDSGTRADITDRLVISRVLQSTRPQFVINAAAYTKVDLAETHADVAHAVNAVGPGYLATECARRGIPLLHFSTDYVFPGNGQAPYREEDSVEPINEYGRSKLLGEQAVNSSGGRTLIVRTQWLFGLRGSSFPRTMWDRARRGLPTQVVMDQWGRPTFCRDVAQMTWRLVEREVTGLLHVANAGVATWYDVAEVVFSRVGAPELLTACQTSDYPTQAKRPLYSVLDTHRMEAVTGASMPTWKEALHLFLSELKADS